LRTFKKTEEIYTVKDVEIWQTNGVSSHQSVIVKEGKVENVGPSAKIAPKGHVIEGKGKVLLPAGVDPQVHLRVPGQPQKETAMSGLEAAVKGGVAALLTMPNTKPVIDSSAVVEQTERELAAAMDHTGVDVLLSVAITMDQRGKVPAPYDELVQSSPRVRAFTDDGVGVVSDDLMRGVYRACEQSGLPILQHAEFPGHGGIIAPGPVQKALGIKAYPDDAEVDMVARDLKLLREFPGARYHLLHTSSKRSLDLIREAKAQGL